MYNRVREPLDFIHITDEYHNHRFMQLSIWEAWGSSGFRHPLQFGCPGRGLDDAETRFFFRIKLGLGYDKGKEVGPGFRAQSQDSRLSSYPLKI